MLLAQMRFKYNIGYLVCQSCNSLRKSHKPTAKTYDNEICISSQPILRFFFTKKRGIKKLKREPLWAQHFAALLYMVHDESRGHWAFLHFQCHTDSPRRPSWS